MSEHIERLRSLVERMDEFAITFVGTQPDTSGLIADAAALRALLDEREQLERERNTLVSMAIADCVRFDDPGPPGRGVHYVYNRQRYGNANDVRAAMLADLAEPD
jgi:hypothetical protein